MTERPSLDGARAKHGRAEHHIEVLQREIDEFVDTNPNEFRDELNLEAGTYTNRIHVRREPDYERWGLLVGDIIHNLRCALDYIVWQLVLLNGKTPGASNQFPVSKTGKAYWAPRGKRESVRDETLRGVAEDHRAFVDAMQPYRAGPQAGTHLLTLLNDLSNADKHRLLQGAWFAIGTPDMSQPPPFTTRDVEITEAWANSGPLKDGAEVGGCRFKVTGPDPHMEMHGEIPIRMGIGEGGIAYAAVAKMVVLVKEIIAEFETRVFEPAHSAALASTRKD